MPRRRSRIVQAREARQDNPSTVNVGGAMQLAVLVCLVLIFLAVMVGFRGGAFSQRFLAFWQGLGPLIEPAVFGFSLLELGAGGLIAALIAGVIWRGLRVRR